MRDDALLLVGRDTPHARESFETHAQRLRSRGIVDQVHVALYEHEPTRELADDFAGIDSETVYTTPMVIAHTHETRNAIPRALSYLPGEVCYCEPIGRSPAVTSIITDRASEQLDKSEGTTLILVGFGSSSQPYQRQAVEYHATRIREGSPYDEVVTSYLIQDPAVECARYNVTNDRAVAVPVFVSRNEATKEKIPARLELDRGGIEYADPLGTHHRLTDAIHAEVEKQRVLHDETSSVSFEATLAADARPVATDGEG